MNLGQASTRSALVNTLGSYAQQILGFLSTLVLARLLTPGDFGAYGLALVVYQFFARARTLGFNEIFFSVPNPDEKDMGTLLWLSTGASLIAVALVGAAQPLLRLVYEASIARMVLLISIVALFEMEGLASVPDAFLRRELSYYRLVTLSTLATGLSLLVTIVLALVGWQVWALVVGYAVKTLTYLLGTWAYAPRFNLLTFNLERARYYLKHGKNLWLGGVGGFLAYLYDDIAVGTFVGTVILGYYRKAYDLALLPLAFISGATGVMMPTYARARDDRDTLTLAATTILDVISKMVFPMGALLAIAAPEIIFLYLGPQWLPAVPILQALVIYAALRPANDVTGSLAVVMGRTQFMRTYGLTVSVLMLVSCTLLTLWMGAVGAALSAGLTVTIGAGMLYWGVLRRYTDVKYGEVFVPPLIALGVASAVTLISTGLLRADAPGVLLLAKALIFGACYLAVLGLLQGRLLFQKARAVLSLLKAPADA